MNNFQTFGGTICATEAISRLFELTDLRDTEIMASRATFDRRCWGTASERDSPAAKMP